MKLSRKRLRIEGQGLDQLITVLEHYLNKPPEIARNEFFVRETLFRIEKLKKKIETEKAYYEKKESMPIQEPKKFEVNYDDESFKFKERAPSNGIFDNKKFLLKCEMISNESLGKQG